MTIDVVIATKDRPDDLRRCLASLARQETRPDRVIVVDASSTPYDEPPPAGLPLEVIGSDPGTRQRNVALDLVRADLVAFFDDDVELEADYLSHVVRWFEEHPACVGLSGNIVNERPRHPLSKVYRWLFALANDDGRLRRSGEVAYVRLPTSPTRVDALSGGNMTFRAREVSGLRFDQDMVFFAEDIDFSLRASRYGELWMIPEARLLHLKSPAARAPRREYVRWAIGTSGYLFAKHRREFGLRRTAFIRRIVGRSVAYILLSIVNRSPRSALGVVEGLVELPGMMKRGAAHGR